MKAIAEILAGPSTEALRAKVAGLHARRAKLDEEIAALEASKGPHAANAADGDPGAITTLADANKAIADRKQQLADLGTAIGAREAELAAAEESDRVAAWQRVVDEQSARLAARLDAARRVESGLKALAPDLTALLELGSEARVAYWNGGGRGTGAEGRGVLIDALEPPMVQRRLADFLFGLGVRTLAGAWPFNGDKATGQSFAEAEAEAQKIYVLDGKTR